MVYFLRGNIDLKFKFIKHKRPEYLLGLLFIRYYSIKNSIVNKIKKTENSIS